MSTTVAVVGGCHAWGPSLLAALEASGARPLALRLPGEPAVAGAETLLVDPADPALGETLEDAGVDALVHADATGRPHADEPAFQRALLRTTHLLAAAAAANASRVVVLSSLRVYGARPDHPSRVPADTPVVLGARATQGNRAWVELERRVDALRSDWPAVAWHVLRPAHVVGRDTSIARLLAGPAAPTLLGFDPLLQLVDARDVGAALARLATASDMPEGPLHLAPDDVLPLSLILRRAGVTAVPVPHPLLYGAAHASHALGDEPGDDDTPATPLWLRALGQRAGAVLDALPPGLRGPLALPPDWLRYACVLDGAPARALGLAARSSSDTLSAFVGPAPDGEEAA